MSKVITPREKNYSDWYNDLVVEADMAEHSDVRGCMVIKPHGYAIWEKMQATLDKMFKDTGHVNAYFPLFIPKSYLSKEASHVEGFAKECAVVTHYRLKNDPNGKGVIVDPDAKLEEELVVRPTSETIIWNTYRGWIQSYRDLPILVNQWANVVRWEMRTRLFLRTAEFLWQEGHTAHATRDEAIKETYCIEALMQDGKALQAGTSHFLGQNFAKAFEVKFADREGKLDYVWATSWGVSTRLMGALIMTHSDDQGLVLPPKLAPLQVVIVPIYKGDEELKKISERCNQFKADLQKKGISVKYDDSDKNKPGWKFAEYELKGVPVRIAIGPRDYENGTVEIARRDTSEKSTVSFEGVESTIENLLEEIQANMFNQALEFRNGHMTEVDDYETFKKLLDEKTGFFLAHWDGTAETEELIKQETKATIRCIPFDGPTEPGVCMVTGKPSERRVLFARAY
jgi:prolyl-tRNA synthetase